MIALSDLSGDVDNFGLPKVLDASEGEGDKVESLPCKKGATMRSNVEIAKSKA